MKFDKEGRNICPVCGKAFYKAPEHIYIVKLKRGNREACCSYTCYRVIKKKQERKKK